MKLAATILLSLTFFCCAQNQSKMNAESTPASDLRYWVEVMEKDPSNEALNAFSFEQKYKIVEYAYNRVGLRSNYPFEQLQKEILHGDPWDDIFSQKMPVNRMAYWILGFWGSYVPIKEAGQTEWKKPSDQIWYYDGEQGELNYLKYANILHKMRPTQYPFSYPQELYDKPSNTFTINFEYKGQPIQWTIENESPGWINSRIFVLYTELCEEEYIQSGNYFALMEGQGGYLMYLTYEAEEYLRKLWDFPKLNRQGKMMTLKGYGGL